MSREYKVLIHPKCIISTQSSQKIVWPNYDGCFVLVDMWHHWTILIYSVHYAVGFELGQGMYVTLKYYQSRMCIMCSLEWSSQCSVSLFTERDGVINLDVLYVMSLNSCVSVSEMRYFHYSDVIMSAIASEITGVSIVYSIICSGADQRKYQSSTSLAFVRGIHWWPAKSPHKGPVMQKMFPIDDIIVFLALIHHSYAGWGTESN